MIDAVFIQSTRAAGYAMVGVITLLLGLVVFSKPTWFYKRNIWHLDRPMPDTALLWNRTFGVIMMLLGLGFVAAAAASALLA